MKKNMVFKMLAVVLVCAMALAFTGAAAAPQASAEPTAAADSAADNAVYVMFDASGSAQKIIVTDSVAQAMSGNGGKSSLPVTDSDGNSVDCGDIEASLPISMKVSYTLDGKTVSPDKLAGKSGHVVMRFDYENLLHTEASVNGRSVDIAVPFAVLTGMIFDSAKFTNVEVSTGKVVSDGTHTIVAGIALPGLQEDLDLDKDIIDIPDYVEVSCDAEDFQLSMTLTVVTDELFSDDAFSKLDTGDLSSAVSQLNDAMTKLMNGSSSLYSGLSTLLAKCGELSDGVAQLSAGLSALDSNSEALNNGAGSVFSSLLAMGNEQLAAAGLDVPTLTVDNYAEALNAVISSLDADAVYASALQQVTDAVNAQTDTIRTGVTDYIRESVVTPQVTEAVTQAARATVEEEIRGKHMDEITAAVTDAVRAAATEKATEQAKQTALTTVLATLNKTMDDYNNMNALEKGVIDAAVSLAMRSGKVQKQISDGVDAYMNSAEGQKTIADNVEKTVQDQITEQMATDAVKQKIASAVAQNVETQMQSQEVLDAIEKNTQQKIKEIIAEKMASDEVQSKLQAAADGAKQVISLKTGLDSYSAFYGGLLSYTAGVGSAAAGAGKLNENMSALISGVTALKDGANELSQGLITFNKEGLSKITGVLGGDLAGISERLQASADAAKNYKQLTNLEQVSGGVNFVYRTGAIGG